MGYGTKECDLGEFRVVQIFQAPELDNSFVCLIKAEFPVSPALTSRLQYTAERTAGSPTVTSIPRMYQDLDANLFIEFNRTVGNHRHAAKCTELFLTAMGDALTGLSDEEQVSLVGHCFNLQSVHQDIEAAARTGDNPIRANQD